jgi:hypothetical protein
MLRCDNLLQAFEYVGANIFGEIVQKAEIRKKIRRTCRGIHGVDGGREGWNWASLRPLHGVVRRYLGLFIKALYIRGFFCHFEGDSHARDVDGGRRRAHYGSAFRGRG